MKNAIKYLIEAIFAASISAIIAAGLILAVVTWTHIRISSSEAWTIVVTSAAIFFLLSIYNKVK